MAELVAAVDVGTGSARAALFSRDGAMLARAERPTLLREPGGERAEQSSEDIWAAVCAALAEARAAAGARPEAVAAIGFDATCSLVLRDCDGGPLAASEDAEPRWDTMLWLDHRAAAEAEEATATGDPALATLGGAMSPEMQLPKLMWLKRRRLAAWARLGAAYDLADFLTFRAAGVPARSLCTLACKWCFRAASAPAWPHGFLDRLGLEDLVARAGLAAAVLPPGADIGPATPEAEAALGIAPGARVAAGLIDAHAGALGVLGGLAPEAASRQAALVAGTSNCVMTLTPWPVAGPGLWGPHPDAVLPGLCATEGGQSTAGALLDQISRLGGAAPDPALHAGIAARIAELRAAEGWDLGGGVHVLPDLRGVRGPAADPRARGAIAGLGLDGSFDGLCRLYWRAAVGVALGLAEAVAALRAAGAPVERLQATGGHVRNALLMQLYATAAGAPVEAHEATDAVLLGAAMAGAAAAGLHPGLAAAASAMRRPGREIAPDPAGAARLARDAAILAAMRRHRAELGALGA